MNPLAALQRPEDSSHPRLHADLSAPFRQHPGGSGGSRVPERWGKESGFAVGFTTAAPIPEQTAPWPSGSGTRGSREEPGSIRAFSQCSPNVRPPALRDLPGWMWFLIYLHGIFLLSPTSLQPTRAPQGSPGRELPIGVEAIILFPSTAHGNTGNNQPFQHTGQWPISARASPGRNKV